MKNLQKLREGKAAAVTLMTGLIDKAEEEKRDLTDEEKAQFDELEAEIQKTDAEIKRLETLEARKAEVEQVIPAAARNGGPTNAPGDPAKKEFESIGEFLFAATMNPNDQRLVWHDRDVQGEQRMDTGTKGGFAVPTQFIGTIRQAGHASAVIRPRAEVIPAGSPPDSAVTIPALDQSTTNMRGGVEVNWIGEGGTKPDTDADFREIKLEPQEVAGTIKVTDKLLRNWGAASPFLEGQLRNAVVQAEESAFMKGNGVGKPLGILNSGALITVARDTANLVKFVDIAAMFSQLKMGGSQVFIANQSILPQLINLVDGDGRLIWQSSAQSGIAGTLMGYPVLYSENSPVLGTTGDLLLADLSHYLIKDGSGPFVASDGGIVNFTSNKTLIKIFFNVDGQPWLKSPLKGDDAREYSPFVALTDPDIS
jgi:HK97 family phage major capsid protein